ncbi:hypothetical protein F4827_006548 [Paraburkholderia bannensis]|jgi:hypothetical protein|uniref:Uncharacterized protein n=1 Tax=Paraburkholderia bannensis TaxID=765414 RepID=A0A7W9U440_9BURK|nr:MULTISPECIES: hypothetical protein [Paraburkholderia]MBB3261708.1 hypothetical protein [Paraburkholderia sp. WP4_3_2]MBB6106672.1 hypothetical protein [Paraburkholderia bannensis]
MFNQTGTSIAPAIRQRDLPGCLSNQLNKDLELQPGDFTFHRKCRLHEKASAGAMPASDRGFLVGVSLSAGHRKPVGAA